MKILVTGSSGFIGFHLVKKLLENKYEVIGLDNFDPYYDVKLKKKRNQILLKNKKYQFIKVDITKNDKVKSIFNKFKIQYVIHLAAQAGVRYSLENPRKYINTNIIGFFNLINISKEKKIKHFIYASTSSVYGDSNEYPLMETHKTENPLSLYAATKKSNELIAHSYSANYRLPTTGLRFFTVFGPFGRPDMALFKFTKNILLKKHIELYNKGNHKRDFTYVDDVSESILRLIKKIPNKKIPYEIFNISSDNPKNLLFFLNKIEQNLNSKAIIKKMNLQNGDVVKTHGSNNKLNKKIKFKPMVKLEDGIKEIVKWYKKYYGI